jgi:YbgC/YbaW family acyl-CoA thioester hydrolase
MARVKLKFPDENPLFTTIIPVRVNDLNYYNHVGNDSVLTIVHEARMQFLRSHGFDEINAGGVSLIMADVMIAYKGESFYGDSLTIDIFAEEITEHSFDLLYRIMTVRENKVNNIAQAKTGMVCFNYDIRKIAEMTELLRKLLTNVSAKGDRP